MQKLFIFLEMYGPSVLRYGMSIIILWFGTQQLVDTANWTAYVPDYAVAISGLTAITLVYINAIFELILGLMLVFGLQTRISALILSLHLFEIMTVVGYGQIGVRDFGLAVATFVIFMNGPDVLSIKKRQKTLQ